MSQVGNKVIITTSHLVHQDTGSATVDTIMLPSRNQIRDDLRRQCALFTIYLERYGLGTMGTERGTERTAGSYGCRSLQGIDLVVNKVIFVE
jgi:hypothetical protein